MNSHYQQHAQPHEVYVQDLSQWPYVNRPGYPNPAVGGTPWGYPTVSQTDAYAVYGPPPRPKRVTHLLHAALSFFTAGLWIPVWVVITVAVHTENTRADAGYWSKIQRYWYWEQTQRRHTLEQGG